MAKRKTIGKKIRFEIFKRDSFKCQYCGASAPDVILEIDHVIPVSKGGDDDITNLITSCRDCNRGKSDVELSDNSIVLMQKKQLEELNEKRIQLEMMIEWRQELKSIDDEIVDTLACEFEELTDCTVNETGKKSIKKWLKKYSYMDISDAIEKSVENYEDYQVAFSKIPSIIYWTKNPQDETMKKLYYIRGIMRNRFSYIDEHLAITILKKAYEKSGDSEELKDIVLAANNWTNWKERMSERGYSIEY